jgi:phage terminase large subunit
LNEQPTIRGQFPKWADLLFQVAPYKAPYGGRGSSKSWSIARALITIAYYVPIRWLCTREIQNSIAESVHKLLSDQIEAMGLSNYFVIQDKKIVSWTGAEFIFEGLHRNITKIKSMEGLDGVWVEEAERVSKMSWQVLIPTVRKPSKALADFYKMIGRKNIGETVDPEIWVSFNPENEKDPTSQMFIEHPLPGALCKRVNYNLNPWFKGSKLEKEMQYSYRTDPDAAAWIWGGQYRKQSVAQIFGGRKLPDGTMSPPKYRVESFEPGTGWNGPYFGADFGFSQDPATLVKCWVYDNKLYIEYEAYAVQVQNNELPTLYDTVPGSRLWVRNRNGDKVLSPQQPEIRADNSRPETIVHVANYGFNIGPAEKWQGSVEDGIAALRSFDEIIIHTRCKHAEEEARLYSYKVDALTGEVTTIIIDKHNHIWDAVRYALQPWIRMFAVEIVASPAPQVAIAEELDMLDGNPLVDLAVDWAPSSW